jgi:hypothetical protein
MNGYLQDANGNNSSGRLMKLLSFVVAIGLAIYGVFLQYDSSVLVSLFLGVALGSEIAQKVTGK